MTAVTISKAVESGIKLRLEIMGIKIEQTVIIMEPVEILLIRMKFRLFLQDKKAPIIIPNTEEANIAFTMSGLSTPKLTFA